VPVTSAPRCDDPATSSTFLVAPFVFDEPQPPPATRRGTHRNVKVSASGDWGFLIEPR
jgi:hypothetical protein